MTQHVGILPRIHDAGLGVNFALLYRVQDFFQIPILVFLIGRVQLVGIRNLVKRCLLHRLQFTGHFGRHQHAHRRQAFLQLIPVIQLHLRQIVHDCPVCRCQRHVPGFGFHLANAQISGSLHQRNVAVGFCIDAVIRRLPALDTDVIQLSIRAFQVQVMPLHRTVRIRCQCSFGRHGGQFRVPGANALKRDVPLLAIRPIHFEQCPDPRATARVFRGHSQRIFGQQCQCAIPVLPGNAPRSLQRDLFSLNVAARLHNSRVGGAHRYIALELSVADRPCQQYIFLPVHVDVRRTVTISDEGDGNRFIRLDRPQIGLGAPRLGVPGIAIVVMTVKQSGGPLFLLNIRLIVTQHRVIEHNQKIIIQFVLILGIQVQPANIGAGKLIMGISFHRRFDGIRIRLPLRQDFIVTLFPFLAATPQAPHGFLGILHAGGLIRTG